MSKVDELLMFDPLDTAEKLTGARMDDGRGFDNPAVGLGFLLAQSHNRKKEALLRELNDTHYNIEAPRFRQIVENFGFRCVLQDDWVSSWDHKESYFIYAHEDGILLSFETFRGKSINSCHAYSNWKSAVDRGMWDCIGSGGWIQGGSETSNVGAIFDSSHDCREALIHKLNKMRNRGEFVRPWVKRPFLWLLHYDESKEKDRDYNAINEARIARLPQWVQDFMGPA